LIPGRSVEFADSSGVTSSLPARRNCAAAGPTEGSGDCLMEERRWPCASAIASRWISILHRTHSRQEGAGNDSSLVPSGTVSSGGAGYTTSSLPPSRVPGAGKGLFLRRLTIGESAPRISPTTGGSSSLPSGTFWPPSSKRASTGSNRRIIWTSRKPFPAEAISPQGLSDAGTLFGKTFSAAECLRILCWFGEPGLGSLPAGCRRTLETRVKAAWNNRSPPPGKPPRR